MAHRLFLPLETFTPLLIFLRLLYSFPARTGQTVCTVRRTKKP